MRLTVIDDDGARSFATTSVTAADPAPVGALASDDFSRTTVGGWGSATPGGAWSVTSSVSRFTVDGSAGLVQLPAGVTGTAFLAGVSSSNADLRMNLSVNKLPSSGSVYLSVAARRVASAGAYQAKIVLTSSDRATLALVRVNAAGGGEVALQSGVIIPGVTYPPGSKLAVRVRATGTTPTVLEARAWPAEGVEPATWQPSVSDTTAALQAAGGIQFSSYLSGSATNGPVLVGVDDLVARVP